MMNKEYIHITDRNGFVVGKAKVRVGMKTNSGEIVKLTDNGFWVKSNDGSDILYTTNTYAAATTRNKIRKSDILR